MAILVHVEKGNPWPFGFWLLYYNPPLLMSEFEKFGCLYYEHESLLPFRLKRWEPQISVFTKIVSFIWILK